MYIYIEAPLLLEPRPLYVCEGSTPRLGRLTPVNDPEPIVQKAVWIPKPVRKGTENLSPTVIRPPDRPARSESLNRLSYPDPSGSVMN